MLTGRGEGKLVPEDLFANSSDPEAVNDRKAVLENTRAQLKSSGKVKVPVSVFGTEGDDGTFVSVFKARITPTMGTDPAPLASKAAVNWGTRCGQQPLSASPCSVDPEAEAEAELYALGREQHFAALDRYRPSTPTEVTVGATGSARRVTLSPDANDDDDVSDLEDD